VIEKSNLILVKEFIIMKLHEEFKLYETMWDEPTSLKTVEDTVTLICNAEKSGKKVTFPGVSFNTAITELSKFMDSLTIEERADYTEINLLYDAEMPGDAKGEMMVMFDSLDTSPELKDGDWDEEHYEFYKKPINRILNISNDNNSDTAEALLLSYFEEDIKDLDESKRSTEDPYGYGPYKTFSDPTLNVGDYVLAPRSFSADKRKTYPAKITAISDRWINYEISGFGFSDKGTKARPGSKVASTISNAKKYLNK
jgi:hypothetical protein